MATLTIPPAVAELSPFATEQFVDFSATENKLAMEAALASVYSKLGREYDMVIGGSPIKTSGKIVSVNPANPSQVVGTHQRAGAEHVEAAIAAAHGAFAGWSRTDVRSGFSFCCGLRS